MNLTPLTWKELIKYNRKTGYKNRPIIIVELDDEMNKKFNAIVIKHDNNKNVHVRYLDNPFVEDKYWWTGNDKNQCGLDPKVYSNISLEFITDSDFQEDGYDDIINYEAEPWRFFQTTPEYPYLNGQHGNLNVGPYYIDEFNRCISGGKIPKCIRNKIKDGESLRRVKNNGGKDGYLCAILDGLDKNFLPIVEEYNNYKNGNKCKKVIEDFKKILKLMITHKFLKEYYESINEENNINDLNLFRDTIFKNQENNDKIKIIANLLKCKIYIFDCNNNNLEIYEYGEKYEDLCINIMKYLNDYETLSC